ncbi:hypothetical protein PVAP13_6KG088235 [Panicum virgatum]|uniref:Uncharacterized protein n=1 Tax=Panicum virgatum TaxID=38727 RepID=A0A8T0R9G5_PANVG|nr:hypothetical protein PVAP13_6KG088235 [Panicum virgatum]
MDEPIPSAPHPTSFSPYSSWGLDDPWAYTPSYFRPHHVEYAAPREPVHAGQPHVMNDRFMSKNRSRVYEKKNIAKQVYVVKRDGRKNISSDLNSIDEKPIDMEESSVDIPSVKSEQKELKKPKIKRKSLLSRTEAKRSHPLELKKKNLAWVRKGSAKSQDKVDVQAKGTTQLKEKRRSERRSSNMRFAPNHQNYLSLHYPHALQMPHMPISWSTSYNMFGYSSYFNFDSWFHMGLYIN